MPSARAREEESVQLHALSEAAGAGDLLPLRRLRAVLLQEPLQAPPLPQRRPRLARLLLLLPLRLPPLRHHVLRWGCPCGVTSSAVDPGLHGDRVHGAWLHRELLLLPAPVVEAETPLPPVREHLLRLPLQQARGPHGVRNPRRGPGVQRVFCSVRERRERDA